MGIGDFYFEVNVNVDTITIYKITGGNIKINKSLYFKEVIPIWYLLEQIDTLT